MTRVCVVTIARNAEDCITATLESVSQQRYADITHLIIDGNSTDATVQIVQKFSSQKDLQVIPQNGKGIANAFNLGLDHATDDLIIFLNSGDTSCSADVIDQAVRSYEQEQWQWAVGEKISVSRRRILQRHVKQFEQWSNDLFLLRNPICHQSTFLTRALAKTVGYYKESLSIGMDYDYNIRAAQVSPPHLLYFPVSYYDTTGVSSRQVLKVFWVGRQLRDQYFSLSPRKRIMLDVLGFTKALTRFLMIPFKLIL